MMNKLKFSIVIPSYNRKEFLVKTINSVLKQEFSSFEVILVDDGSTDETGEYILNKYKNVRNFRYFYKQNEERGAARNYGVQKAKGQFVMFLDSDDYMKEGCLELYNEKICKYDPEVIFSKYNFFNLEKYRSSSVENWEEGWYPWQVFLEGNYFASMICFRKKLNDILVPDSMSVVTSEDWLFNIMKTYKNKFYFINELCFTMVEHDDRSMNQDQEKIIETKLNALSFLKEKIELSEIEQRTLNSYAYFFVAIHSYVGGLRKMALKYIFQSKKVPFKRKLILFTKVLIGRRKILWLKEKLAL